MSNRRYIYLLGTGRCGLTSLRALLNAQPETMITAAEAPFLPWRPLSERTMKHRIDRRFREETAAVLGESGWFFLPYVEQILQVAPDVKVVFLLRNQLDAIDSIKRWTLGAFSDKTNHWSALPSRDVCHHPVMSQTYPKYESADLDECARHYCREYELRAVELSEKYPKNCRVFDTYNVLNDGNQQSELLDFCGYDKSVQEPSVGIHHQRWKPIRQRPSRNQAASDPSTCAILVPAGSGITIDCEESLRELERRGFAVHRLPGFAAVDQARNILATKALLAGVEETIWIDSDIEFMPDDVEKLRLHKLPIVAGIYAKKGVQAIASNVMPGTESFEFGRGGGLYSIAFAGTGFLYVHRHVYETIQMKLGLPVCNELFGEVVIPFFQPRLHPQADSTWYLAEDFSFSQCAKDCGFKLVADTTIRLWHVGTYRYGWEDAGKKTQRFDSYTMNFTKKQK